MKPEKLFVIATAIFAMATPPSEGKEPSQIQQEEIIPDAADLVLLVNGYDRLGTYVNSFLISTYPMEKVPGSAVKGWLPAAIGNPGITGIRGRHPCHIAYSAKTSANGTVEGALLAIELDTHGKLASVSFDHFMKSTRLGPNDAPVTDQWKTFLKMMGGKVVFTKLLGNYAVIGGESRAGTADKLFDSLGKKTTWMTEDEQTFVGGGKVMFYSRRPTADAPISLLTTGLLQSPAAGRARSALSKVFSHSRDGAFSALIDDGFKKLPESLADAECLMVRLDADANGLNMNVKVRAKAGSETEKNFKRASQLKPDNGQDKYALTSLPIFLRTSADSPYFTLAVKTFENLLSAAGGKMPAGAKSSPLLVCDLDPAGRLAVTTTPTRTCPPGRQPPGANDLFFAVNATELGRAAAVADGRTLDTMNPSRTSPIEARISASGGALNVGLQVPRMHLAEALRVLDPQAFGTAAGINPLPAPSPAPARTTGQIALVKRADKSTRNRFYVSNRPPLLPSEFIKLPIGAITPKGWLRAYLLRQTEGICGRMHEINQDWLKHPWWWKSYGDLGYVLGDERITKEAFGIAKGIMDGQTPDGNIEQMFDGTGFKSYHNDVYTVFALQSYYEFTGDKRVLDCLREYYRFFLTIPDDAFLMAYWEKTRGGDYLYGAYWLYNRTGDAFLLDVAEKIHRNTADWTVWPGDCLYFPNINAPKGWEGVDDLWHNVNIAMGFREPATYHLQSKNPDDLIATRRVFDRVRQTYGQVPGGMFGADESARKNAIDPRQGIETCGVVHQMESNQLLTLITGDRFWMDNTEDVAYNTYPACLTADMKALRYFTAPNMISSDRRSHAWRMTGPRGCYAPVDHGCCQVNHGNGWPYLAENLWLATPDNGLCAAFYCESEVTAKVGNGIDVTLIQKTHYPFEEDVEITVNGSGAFPLYFRVPEWCKAPELKINGAVQSLTGDDSDYIKVSRTWSSGDKVSLRFPMEVRIRRWAANGNSASVNYGPLTFSVKMGKKVTKVDPKEIFGENTGDPEKWPAYEIVPTTPWNYGLVLDDDLSKSFTVERLPWPKDDFPFTPDAVPIQLKAKVKRIPQWMATGADPDKVPKSPVTSESPVETITLVPMGATRLRISAFPVIGTSKKLKK